MESEVGESIISGDYGDRESSPSNIDSPSDSETEAIQKKRKIMSETRKLSGSAEYTTSYLPSWETTYDFIMRSSSKGNFYCKVCHIKMHP